jgi:hypothetical protein
MSELHISNRVWMACALTLLLGLSPATATAGGSVLGHGKLDNGPFSPSQISIDAWLDDNGVPQGTMVWVGDVTHMHPGGPADPWFIEVVDLAFDGNTAFVIGVVVHSVFPGDIGNTVYFTFTDNSGTCQPDEINGQAIEAGNITVRD